MLPEVTARLNADVSDFIAAWDRAADAATRAAARIRAAQQGLGDIDINSSRFGDLNSELERLTRTARQAADSIREFGNGARGGGRDIDELARSARQAAGALGEGGAGAGGGLIGAMGKSRAGAQVLAAGVVILVSLLPAVAAAALAAGAALQGMAVVAAVVVAGWKGISDAAELLKGRLAALKSQLENTFRQGLTQEFDKLGQALAGLGEPLKAIASATVGVVKEFTGWIRSSQGLEEIKTMLGGVENMVKALGPGAKAAAQGFTAFGAAAAPSMGKIGEAISSVFENLTKVIEKGKETGQLQKAFEAGAAAIEAFGEVAAGLLDILIEMAGSGGEPAADAIKKFGVALQDAAPLIGTLLGYLAQCINILMTVVGWFTKLAKALEPVYRTMNDVNKGITDFMKSISPEKIDDFGKSVAGLALKIGLDLKKGFDDAVAAVKKWADDTKKGIEKGVDEAIKAVNKFVDDIIKAVKKWVDDTVKAVQKWADELVKEVKDGVDKAIQAIKELPQKTLDALSDWVQKLKQAAKDAWDGLVQAVKEGIDTALAEIEKLPQKAKQSMDKWVTDMKQAGKDAGEGLDEGLASAIGNVVETATMMAEQAMAAIKGALGIASPSIVMRDQIGKMIPAGIALGIIANAGAVTDAMNRTGLGALTAGRGANAISGSAMGRSSQVFTLQVSGGADSAMGTAIARLAQQGKLKITSKAIVGGR